jgi:hypothetical protein
MRALLVTLTFAVALTACFSGLEGPASEGCNGGCPCFRTESACKASGCPWTDAGCENEISIADGG